MIWRRRGVNINVDRIIELCYIKLYPNGNEESMSMRINPEMHIPESSSAIHGITDEDVKDCPTFKQVAANLEKHSRDATWQDSTPTDSISRCW